jgi:pectate lyase-like protein
MKKALIIFYIIGIVIEGYGQTYVIPKGGASGGNSAINNDSLQTRFVSVTPTTIRTRGPFYAYESIYLDNGSASGVFQYNPSDHTTVDDSAMTFVTNLGYRWNRVLDHKGDINVVYFGATGNGVTDDWYAIQKAITYAGNTSGISNVVFPAATYSISQPLIVYKMIAGIYYGVTVNMIGQSNVKDAAGGNAIIAPTFNNTFALGFQQAKGCHVQNLWFQGQFTLPNTFTNVQIDTLPASAWDDGSARQDVYSPYAAIVIDPFSDSNSYISTADMYPGLHSYCPAGMSKSGSTDIEISNCRIINFVVGIIITPSLQQNGEMINVIDCQLGGNKVGYATCQAQSKDNWLIRTMCWGGTYTIVDNVTYAHSALGGGSVHVSGANIAGQVHQFCNIYNKIFKSTVDNVYSESLFKIGYTNGGFAGIQFTGCDFNFTTAGIGVPYPDYFIAPATNVTFKDCKLNMYTGPSNIRMLLTGSIYMEGGSLNAPPLSYLNVSNSASFQPVYKNVAMFYSGGVLGTQDASNNNPGPGGGSPGIGTNPIYYNTYHFAYQIPSPQNTYIQQVTYSTNYERKIPLGICPVNVNTTTWTGYLLPATPSDTALLEPGDFLISTANNPIGMISSISGDTVYFNFLAAYIKDSSYNVYADYYQMEFPAITGNLAGSSNIITAYQAMNGAPVQGQRLDMPQFKTGTKVVSVSNDTVTLSEPSQTGVSYTDFTWINGYPKIEMWGDSTPERLFLQNGSLTAVGNSYYYQVSTRSTQKSGLLSGGDQVIASYYILNTTPQGDTSKHKFKYRPLNVSGHTIFIPTNGGTVLLINNQSNFINPAGSLSTLNILFPFNSSDNDKVEIKFGQAIGTVSWPGNVINPPSSVTAGGYYVFKKDNASQTWY